MSERSKQGRDAMTDPALPNAVQIREVGPRDGFQNEPEEIPTADKIQLIDGLARTGVKRLEVASFVRPDVIPQLSDAVEVLDGIDAPEDVSLRVLVPNERGLDRALRHQARFHEVVVFVSASETHNRKNVGCSVEDSLGAIASMAPRIHDHGLRACAAIATAFGCPYEGVVDRSRLLDIAGRLVDIGIDELVFGDTTGMANPVQAKEVFRQAAAMYSGVELTAHFHNTRGQGLANALSALQAGVTSFESSFGELGGCPVPPGATGNVASEDLVSMLHEMGIETGVDLAALVAQSRAVQGILGRPLTSHVIVAGPVEWGSTVSP